MLHYLNYLVLFCKADDIPDILVKFYQVFSLSLFSLFLSFTHIGKERKIVTGWQILIENPLQSLTQKVQIFGRSMRDVCDVGLNRYERYCFINFNFNFRSHSPSCQFPMKYVSLLNIKLVTILTIYSGIETVTNFITNVIKQQNQSQLDVKQQICKRVTFFNEEL